MQMVEIVHHILSEKLAPGDRAVDATVGNGWDTLKMCEIVGAKGKVYGFDIQPEAIEHTKQRLEDNGCALQAELFCCSHSEAGERIHEPVKAFTMNLGYLPGGDKGVVTKRDSTVQALEALVELLVSGGVGTVLVYYGHEGGKEEKAAVEAFMEGLAPGGGQVTRMAVVNRKNCPPVLYVLEKN